MTEEMSGTALTFAYRYREARGGFEGCGGEILEEPGHPLLIHLPWFKGLLVSSPEPLILVPAFSRRDSVALAVAKGHHLLVVVERDEGIEAEVSLPRADRGDIRDALRAMGVTKRISSSWRLWLGGA